ncbi:hypothetical protein PROFUN_11780 [Planoprotostelium fungivorum]|uniref:Uncharacterized protein n=1 Tax=Planoprotostelium fungivorum TaxID=1890364 RepID=A0A2P6N8N4_9EUKA|nr:hypothetical protein PROFUN_11780 [Planoprotostelium fungivorum]
MVLNDDILFGSGHARPDQSPATTQAREWENYCPETGRYLPHVRKNISRSSPRSPLAVLYSASEDQSPYRSPSSDTQLMSPLTPIHSSARPSPLRNLR